MDERRKDPPARAAFLASVALHVAAIAAVTISAASADPRPPQVRVYRVDIVSPAPNVLGEPPAEPPAPSQPAAPAPADPEPAAEPPAPEPEPEPAPPRETPKAPEPRPERARTPERSKVPQPETPRRPASERETTARTPASQPKNREPAERTTTTGTSGTRSAGTGTRPGPATGRNPDPASPGGEGLNVRTQGVACPENYCNNVVRQVRRFFRAPEGTQGASGNVCFTLFRDGSVDEVTVERQRGGGFQFRLALVEAVEQAGLQRAFGALPRGFESESIQLCVLMSPATT